MLLSSGELYEEGMEVMWIKRRGRGGGANENERTKDEILTFIQRMRRPFSGEVENERGWRWLWEEDERMKEGQETKKKEWVSEWFEVKASQQQGHMTPRKPESKRRWTGRKRKRERKMNSEPPSPRGWKMTERKAKSCTSLNDKSYTFFNKQERKMWKAGAC